MMKNKLFKLLASGIALSAIVGLTPMTTQANEIKVAADSRATDARFHSMEIQGIDIAYREAGDPSNSAVVLLHRFPTSSHMYRELIPQCQW